MGLAVKTYQSDIFNNWINTEWIDGENGINAITAVDVSEGKLELDTLILAKKVYNMLKESQSAEELTMIGLKQYIQPIM